MRTSLGNNTAPYIIGLFTALLMGLLAAKGEPIYIMLFAGALGGLFLITQPVALLWATLFTTLIIAGTIQYFIPTLQQVWWSAYGLAAMLFATALLPRAATQSTTSTGISASTMAALLFLTSAALSTLLNKSPLLQVALSLKSILLFGGLWVALALIPIDKDSIKRWLMGFLFIGLVQWLPVLYQYIFVRSSRIGRGLGNVEASDSVVGTFGGSMELGGLTAVLAFYLVMLIIFVLSFYKHRLLEKRRLLLLLLLLAGPLLLMEVKIIFIYLPISLLLLYKDNLRHHPGSFIGGTIIVTALLATVLLAYQAFHWSSTGRSIEDNIKALSSYSFSERAGAEKRSYGIMSRREALEFWWKRHGLNHTSDTLIGHGLGASRTQGLAAGDVATRYFPLKLDTTGITMLLWDTGLIGVTIFIGLLISGYRSAARLARSPAMEPWQKALALGLKAMIPLFFISLFYRADIPYIAPMMFLFMTVFGLLAWLARQEPLPHKTRHY